jgi:hypothetical protein
MMIKLGVRVAIYRKFNGKNEPVGNPEDYRLRIIRSFGFFWPTLPRNKRKEGGSYDNRNRL